MQDLPQSKAEKRAYIEKQLNVWETYDKQQEEKVINKISGFTPPKSINEIIKSHGNYENIEEEASNIVKERLLETIEDSSLKENLKQKQMQIRISCSPKILIFKMYLVI